MGAEPCGDSANDNSVTGSSSSCPCTARGNKKGTAKINQGVAFIDFLKKNTIIANRPQILGKLLVYELCFGSLTLKTGL